jgi:hypothetical protein
VAAVPVGIAEDLRMRATMCDEVFREDSCRVRMRVLVNKQKGRLPWLSGQAASLRKSLQFRGVPVNPLIVFSSVTVIP